MTLDDWARAFLERPRLFATLATLGPDGAPSQVVVWYVLRGGAILVNSRVGRQWPGNLRRDPRFSFMVEQGYEWLAARGTAVTVGDAQGAQADIAELAHRYLERARADRIIEERFSRQERISFLLHPESIVSHRDEP